MIASTTQKNRERKKNADVMAFPFAFALLRHGVVYNRFFGQDINDKTHRSVIHGKRLWNEIIT